MGKKKWKWNKLLLICCFVGEVREVREVKKEEGRLPLLHIFLYNEHFNPNIVSISLRIVNYKSYSMNKKTLYTAEATVSGGRNGKALTSDNSLNLELRSPVGMGGPQGKYTNPEQLLACGYAACFESALAMHAHLLKIKTESTQITARVHLNSSDEGGFSLAIDLKVKVGGINKEQAEELVTLAHQTCPYSKAFRNNIEIEITIVN
jgi:Ohr subfamily peroxiredoxin